MSEAEYRCYNPTVFCPWCGAEMQHMTLEVECRSDRPVFHFYGCGRKTCRCESPARETRAEAYKAATKRASRWISVDVALPAEETYVIGFSTKGKRYYPYLYFYPDKQEFRDEMYNDRPAKITHWMPFPDAPEEDEHDE